MRNLILTAAIGAASVLVASSAHAAAAYALTDENSIIGFDTATPNVLTSAFALRTAANVAIEDLIGIDYRPSNSTLYGVGRLGTIYTIDPTTGIATPGAHLNTTLSGARFGFDFNPVADRLRITSDTKQSYRIDVTTGAVTVDSPLNPGNPTVTSSAYTAVLQGATTLYDIDSVTDTLYVQNPPNAGTLVPVGPLGINVGSLSGFDIATGVTGGQVAFAALQLAPNGISELYSINLGTGAATLVGTIGGGDFVDGLALVVPEPTTLGLIGGMGVLALRRRAR